MKLHRTLNPVFLPLMFVPLADVAAALIFYLLLGGNYLLQPGVAVTPPDSPFLLSPQRDPQVVAITGPPAPAIYFDDRRMTAQELGSALASTEGGGRTLVIKADRAAPVDLLVSVVNTAMQHGRPVVLATSQSEP